MSAKRGLGKGLSNLGLTELLDGIQQPIENVEVGGAQLRELPVTQINPGKYQPRRQISQEALQELADSIEAQGIIQPIVVRTLGENSYELIAGERRWRAAQLAGLEQVPAVIRELDDESAIAMSLIENIQRQDLNAIEEAMALHRLIEEFEMTHEQVAKAVGKSRAAVSNLLRLLQLPTAVRAMVEQGKIDMGHARALLSLAPSKQVEVAQAIIEQALSVRQTEELIRQLNQPAEDKAQGAGSASIDPDVKRLQNNLRERLGAVVNIRHAQNGKGRLVIHYNTLDELDGILDHIQ